MFNRLGSFIARHWVVTIVAWAVLLIAVRLTAPSWDEVVVDGDLAYMPHWTTTYRAHELMQEAFPDVVIARSQMVVVVERPGKPLARADFAVADQLVQWFQQAQESQRLPVVGVKSHQTEVYGERLISQVSEHGQATLVLVDLSTEYIATANIRVLGEVVAKLDELRTAPGAPEGLQLGVTGSGAIGGDMEASTAESIKNSEMVTISLVLLILLVVYRAPLLVLVPLVTIVVSLTVAVDLVAMLACLNQRSWMSWWDFKIFKTTQIFIIVILYGGGTDYCLFLISRYKEELAAGQSAANGVWRSLSLVGAPVAASAATTIIGLGMMAFANFGKFRNAGPAIAICLSMALLASLTLAPAMLAALGRWVFWPFTLKPTSEDSAEQEGQAAATPRRGFWQGMGRKIIHRPGLIFVGSVLLLSPLAWKAFHFDTTYDLSRDLMPTRPSIRGMHMLVRHFGPGHVSPVTVLIRQPDGGLDTPDGKHRIGDLASLLQTVEGVDTVLSIDDPLGQHITVGDIFSRAGRMKLGARRHPEVVSRYLTQVPELRGTVTRLDVILKDDPFSKAAVATLDRIDATVQKSTADSHSPWYGAQVEYGGTTGGIRDLMNVTSGDQIRIQVFVALGVIAVLIVLLRRPAICIYLILTVIFSYLVTIGFSDLVFAWYYGADYQGLDWKAPIFLFVILVAVGEDYNIYLITRIFEEQARYGLIEGLREGVVRTGGIITSCGLIMAGSFVAMMVSSLHSMVELGFALSMGIILDTFVVRTILVPAFLALAYRLRSSKSDRDKPAPALVSSAKQEG